MTRSMSEKSSSKSLANPRERESMLSEPPPEPPSCKAFVLIGCLLSSFVLIGIALVILAVIRNPCAVLPDPIHGNFCHEIKIRIREPVITEIRKLERLDTLELNLSAIVTVKQKHIFPIPYTEILVYGVCGRATLGVDLDKLQDSDLQISGTTITVTLPMAEVFSVDPTLSLDVAETELSLVEGSTDRRVMTGQACNHAFSWTRHGEGTKELIEEAQEQATVQFRTRAEEEDVLERAQRNAEKELDRFLIFAGFENVIFEGSKEGEGTGGGFGGMFQSLGQLLQSLSETTLDE